MVDGPVQLEALGGPVLGDELQAGVIDQDVYSRLLLKDPRAELVDALQQRWVAELDDHLAVGLTSNLTNIRIP